MLIIILLLVIIYVKFNYRNNFTTSENSLTDNTTLVNILKSDIDDIDKFINSNNFKLVDNFMSEIVKTDTDIDLSTYNIKVGYSSDYLFEEDDSILNNNGNIVVTTLNAHNNNIFPLNMIMNIHPNLFKDVDKSIDFWWSSKLPGGWAVCDGSDFFYKIENNIVLLSKTTLDGYTQVLIPNLLNKYIMGYNSIGGNKFIQFNNNSNITVTKNLNDNVGENVVTITGDHIPNHNHNVNDLVFCKPYSDGSAIGKAWKLCDSGCHKIFSSDTRVDDKYKNNTQSKTGSPDGSTLNAKFNNEPLHSTYIPIIKFA